MDMILTGKSVYAEEALAIGLANYVVPAGKAREEAEKLAAKIAAWPQVCMRSDRESAYAGFDQSFDNAMKQEFEKGMQVVQSGETVEGATRFSEGIDRVLP